MAARALFAWPVSSVLGIAAAVLCACGERPVSPPTAQTSPKVGYVVVKAQRLPLTVDLPGRAQSTLMAEVRPQVGGLLLSRMFKEGTDVKIGQVLYQIDPATYKADVDSASAALARAEAQVGSATLKAQRTAELASIKAVSQQDADDAAGALKQAQADVRSARAALESTRIALDRTRITAPIAGRIGRSAVTAGALVAANQPTALATVQRLDPINVDFTQSSNVVLFIRRLMAEGKVRPGDAKVRLLLDDGSTYPYLGKLQFSEVGVESSTGSITLRAEFPNPEAGLLPGMYLRGVVEAGVVEQALLVPQEAITRDTAGNGIGYVITADGRLEQRRIVTQRAIGDKWLVTDGVKAGDRLAVQGQDRARPGMAVDASAWQSAPGAAEAGSKAPIAPASASKPSNS